MIYTRPCVSAAECSSLPWSPLLLRCHPVLQPWRLGAWIFGSDPAPGPAQTVNGECRMVGEEGVCRLVCGRCSHTPGLMSSPVPRCPIRDPGIRRQAAQSLLCPTHPLAGVLEMLQPSQAVQIFVFFYVAVFLESLRKAWQVMQAVCC